MKIESRDELEYTYKLLDKVIRHRDRCALNPAWTPDQRASVVDGIDAQIRKTERDIQEYLALHPEVDRIAQPV